jgi:excisionase family DNA binding protein
LLTPDEVVTWLGISRRTITTMVAAGKLTPMRYGRESRYLQSEVLGLIADRKKYWPRRKAVAT